jgi:integrase
MLRELMHPPARRSAAVVWSGDGARSPPRPRLAAALSGSGRPGSAPGRGQCRGSLTPVAWSLQRVLAIPHKRLARPLVSFLSRSEVEAILSVPDHSTWTGRRDHALLLLAVQAGLRLSELTSLTRQDLHLGSGAYVRCHGKGRKDRCTPLTQQTVAVLRVWLQELGGQLGDLLFPSRLRRRLSSDAIQRLLRVVGCAGPADQLQTRFLDLCLQLRSR